MSGNLWKALAAIAGLGSAAMALTPVEEHGALHVTGNQILDSHNNPAQLAGMSLYWSGWKPAFYSRASVNWLAYDWNVSVVRCAMGIEGGSNYLDTTHHGDTKNMAYVDSVVQAAVDLGIYVIIDWHDHNAPDHLPQAVKFFQRMATKWGSYPNVIYELYNEPHGTIAATTTAAGEAAWTWAKIKPYLQTVTDSIRKIDKSNLILLGNPDWDQKPNAALGSKVSGTNLAYTFHFYAGSHYMKAKSGFTDIGSSAQAALDGGLALFISEWGTTNADGGGGADTNLYLSESTDWLQWAAERNISWCNWSVANLNERSAILKPAANPLGWWPDSVISPSGKYVRSQIQNVNSTYGMSRYTYPEPPIPVPPPPHKPDTTLVPNRIQAEGYVDSFGVQFEDNSDDDMTKDLGWTENGDWAEYMINVPAEGKYYLHARVATPTDGGSLVVSNIDGDDLGTVNVTTTGGWQNWVTVTDTVPVTLKAGLQRIRINFVGVDGVGIFNVNWLKYDSDISSIKPRQAKSGLRLVQQGGAIEIRSAEGYSNAALRDPSGRVLARTSLGADGNGTLRWSGKGLVLVELQGTKGRRIQSLVKTER